MAAQHALLDDGWLTAPGSLFHATPRPSTRMRINFAATQEARLWRALREARERLLSRPGASPPAETGAAAERISA